MKIVHSTLAGLALTSALALAASAQAGDLYHREESYKDGPAAYGMAANWSGFYFGGSVGGAWGDLDVKDKDDAFGGNTTKVKPDGVFGGGQIGYNFQRGNIVFGLEGDLGGLDFDESRSVKGSDGFAKVGIGSGLYGDITGRIGFVVDRALIYGKGGFAFFDGDRKFSALGASRVGDIDTFTGWTVGGGVEYKFRPNWSVKAEYQYFDFGSQDFDAADAEGRSFRFKDDLTANTVKVGINYHLGGDYAPLK